MKLLSVLFLVSIGWGQTTVGGTAGLAGQSATATLKVIKVPKLTLALACSGVSQDASGNVQVPAGTSITCSVTLNLPVPQGASVSLTSADPTSITAPAVVLIPACTIAPCSANFPVTATP